MPREALIPRCTLVVGAHNARGKTTIALLAAGHRPRTTFATVGVDIVFRKPLAYLVDTPPPPRSQNIHGATAPLLRDVSDALVVHSPEACTDSTKRLCDTLHALCIEHTVVVSDARHWSWDLAGTPAACVQSAADADHALTKSWPEAHVLLAAGTTLHMPTWAHATALAMVAGVLMMPRYRAPHRTVQAFLLRAQQCGGRARAPMRHVDCTASAVLHAAVALTVCASIATVRQPASHFSAILLPAPVWLHAALKTAAAPLFALQQSHRAQISAVGMWAMQHGTNKPCTHTTKVCTAVGALLGVVTDVVPVHAAAVLLGMLSTGAHAHHERSALVALGLVARTGHKLITLVLLLYVAAHDDVHELCQQWGTWLAPLLLLIYY